jgi:hypothetical protein
MYFVAIVGISSILEDMKIIKFNEFCHFHMIFLYKMSLNSNYCDKNTSMLFECASLQFFFGATEI